MSVLLGSGSGTFGDRAPLRRRRAPVSVAVGDFNGDGKPDLAVANASSGNVGVLLGSGSGTFASAVNYAAGILPVSVAVGDFNGDGKPDPDGATRQAALVSARHRHRHLRGRVSYPVSGGGAVFRGGGTSTATAS